MTKCKNIFSRKRQHLCVVAHGSRAVATFKVYYKRRTFEERFLKLQEITHFPEQSSGKL
jgi:hypothetical protein